MAHINRKYIDRHWLVFVFRGALALVFGLFALFKGDMSNLPLIFSFISVYLLSMCIVDSAGALYNSNKKHGWVNSVIDAGVDIVAALVLLFLSNNDIVFQLVTIAVYTCVSGLIDIFHGFLSTTDPTDRFIRVLAGICGCILGIVILNAGPLEQSTFIRFFGVYSIITGITSMIYGVHNKAQKTEDSTARKEAAKVAAKTKAAKRPASKKSK